MNVGDEVVLLPRNHGQGTELEKLHNYARGVVRAVGRKAVLVGFETGPPDIWWPLGKSRIVAERVVKCFTPKK
jgi:hypothetical protein